MNATAEASKRGNLSSGFLQFRLVHLFYAVTLLASGLATFGVSGLPVALCILLFWGYVFSRPSPARAFVLLLLVFLISSCLIGLLLPAIQVTREAGRGTPCNNNLKQIMIALQYYCEDYGTFPPAFVAGKDGSPWHSWRVLILPYLQSKALHDAYDFNEPWNGPNNRKLLDQMPPVYACPAHLPSADRPAWCSDYLAVVGPRTVWRASGGRTLREIPDGTSNTVALVEHHSANILWMEPRDMTFTDAMRWLTSKDPKAGPAHGRADFFYERFSHGGRMFAFVDGSVQWAPPGMKSEVWSSLLNVDDGVAVNLKQWKGVPTLYTTRPRLDNWFRLAVFVLLALLPTPWVGWEPEGE